MKCPHCLNKTQPTFDGPQRWCVTCGTLTWVNPDGTVRQVSIPERQKIDQRQSTTGNGSRT